MQCRLHGRFQLKISVENSSVDLELVSPCSLTEGRTTDALDRPLSAHETAVSSAGWFQSLWRLLGRCTQLLCPRLGGFQFAMSAHRFVGWILAMCASPAPNDHDRFTGLASSHAALQLRQHPLQQSSLFRAGRRLGETDLEKH